MAARRHGQCSSRAARFQSFSSAGPIQWRTVWCKAWHGRAATSPVSRPWRRASARSSQPPVSASGAIDRKAPFHVAFSTWPLVSLALIVGIVVIIPTALAGICQILARTLSKVTEAGVMGRLTCGNATPTEMFVPHRCRDGEHRTILTMIAIGQIRDYCCTRKPR